MSGPSATQVPLSLKTTRRIVGALFLSAFILYGGGTSLVVSSVGDETAVPANADSLAQLCAGSALLLLNSAALVLLGVLAVPRRTHPTMLQVNPAVASSTQLSCSR